MGWFGGDNDGGFLWLVGHILHAVDSDFDYGATGIGVQTQDSTGTRYVETRRNHKGEPEHIGIIETNYNDWRADNRNVNDLRQLSDQYDNGAWDTGGWFW